MHSADTPDPFTKIDPMIVLMDAYRLLLLAIRGITEEHGAQLASDGVTVIDVLARAAERHRALTATLTHIARAQGTELSSPLRGSVDGDHEQAARTMIETRIDDLGDAHIALSEAYASLDFSRVDETLEAIAVPGGTPATLRHLLIEHAMEQGAEAYLIAAALGRTLD